MRSPVSGDLLLSLAALSMPARSPFSVIFSWSLVLDRESRDAVFDGLNELADLPFDEASSLLSVERLMHLLTTAVDQDVEMCFGKKLVRERR